MISELVQGPFVSLGLGVNVMKVDKNRLSFKFTILVMAVFVFAACAYLCWDISTQSSTMRDKVLTEARTLNLQMKACWDYIDASQAAINYNSDGSYDFKDIYCSIAGKNIAQRFTSQAAGYAIRYARTDPRSGTDEPDAFEAEAIVHFEAGEGTEFYRIEEYDGREAFRYASALEIKRNCLNCHGDPAGEKDETGYFKEGMKLGDLAGITSIVIPLEPYMVDARVRTVRNIAFFLALALAVVFVIRYALKRWVVGPLNDSNERLHDENKAQQDFLAIMSHELRTPLSSIIAFTDVWEKDGEHHSDQERRMVGEIKENSRVLLNLVNNTIDVAKLESGRFGLSYDEVDLVDVIQSITATVGPLATKNGISIVKRIAPETPIIHSDSEALRKVFMNIIGNAVKFSGEGATVEIEVTAQEETVRVTVRDEGPGIPVDQQSHVFERFTQASGPDGARSESGSGLGLFLAKSLVERLGGTICLESEVGVGSTFTVSLPVVAPGSLSSHGPAVTGKDDAEREVREGI